MIIAIYTGIAIGVVIWLAAAIRVASWIRTAPEGYERKGRFHYGKPHTK